MGDTLDYLEANGDEPSDGPDDDYMSDTEYVRQLEDAALTLWAELPAAEVSELNAEMPRLMAFLAHLHQRVEHEQAMVRRNVWAV